MPKPASITAADIDQWHANLVRDAANDAIAKRLLDAGEAVVERAYYTGCWLGGQLADAGCPDDLNERICFANGQRMFAAADPWATTEHALAEYRAGRWEEPGEELALRIFEEQFPELARRSGEPARGH